MGRCTHTRASAHVRGCIRAHALTTLHPVADTTRFHPYPISYKPDGRKPVTNKICDMKNKQSIHEKAIRLVEGGIVEVDGHSVRLNKDESDLLSCELCDMGCLCHLGTEMCSVCVECASIVKGQCFLELVTLDSVLP